MAFIDMFGVLRKVSPLNNRSGGTEISEAEGSGTPSSIDTDVKMNENNVRSDIGRIQVSQGWKFFEWTIYDFFDLKQAENCLHFSPVFSFQDAEWCLFICPHARTRIYSTTLGLRKVASPVANHHISYMFGITGMNGIICMYHSGQFEFQNSGNSEARAEFFRHKRGAACKGNVTIFCILRDMKSGKSKDENSSESEKKECASLCEDTIEKNRNYGEHKTKRCSRPGEQRLKQNFRELLSSGVESDIILNVHQREFKCHRAILTARSSVFAAMMKHDMKEKDSGVVIIDDCHPGAFQLYLEHLYTGSTENFSDDSVFDLYRIADKYDASDLKEECVDFILNSLSVENFCDVARLSLQYNESALLEKVIIFFAKNIRKVSASVKWQLFLKEHPTEANEFNLKALEYHGIGD